MVNNSNSQIKLTSEQQAQLNEWRRRLENTQNELAIATEKLRVSKLDDEKVTAHIKHQQEIVEQLEKILDNKKGQLAEIEKNIEVNQEILKDLVAQAKLVAKSNDKKHIELKTLEEEIKTATIAHEKAVKDYTSKQDQLLKDQKQLDKVKGLFLKAIEGVTWK